MFTGGGVLAKPAGKGRELTHVASHELPRQHAGIDGLPAHKQTSINESLGPSQACMLNSSCYSIN